MMPKRKRIKPEYIDPDELYSELMADIWIEQEIFRLKMSNNFLFPDMKPLLAKLNEEKKRKQIDNVKDVMIEELIYQYDLLIDYIENR